MKLRAASLLVLLACLWTAESHAGDPIEWKLTAVPDADAQTFEIILHSSIAAPWHVYGRTGGGQGQIGLDLKLRLPPGIEAISDWERPKPDTIHEGRPVEIYTGHKTFRQKLRVVGGATGKVTVTVTFQACTPQFCAMPETAELTATIPPRSVPSARK